jgi:hypothetical protein
MKVICSLRNSQIKCLFSKWSFKYNVKYYKQNMELKEYLTCENLRCIHRHLLKVWKRTHMNEPADQQTKNLSPSTIKPTNALYFLVMFVNPTHVSAATQPSLGVQGHVHCNIHCSIWYHHFYTTTLNLEPWTPDDGSVAAETCVGLMNITKK